MSHRILLVEDEPGLVLTLTDRLRGEGYEVESAGDGEAALACASGGGFDLLILDLVLPRKNGLEVCREIRRSGNDVPVLMLTARGQVVDKVLGLEIGADDYLTKPFEMMELVARIRALLRRAAVPPGRFAGVYQFGGVRVDFRSAEVLREGRRVNLSAREFLLLRYLVERRGAALTREELLREVWGYDPRTTTRTLDVHIAWLRQKLEDNPKHPRYILTLRGLGYKFTG